MHYLDTQSLVKTLNDFKVTCYCECKDYKLILPIQNDKKPRKMIETLAHGYSSEGTQKELSNEYKHGRV